MSFINNWEFILSSFGFFGKNVTTVDDTGTATRILFVSRSFQKCLAVNSASIRIFPERDAPRPEPVIYDLLIFNVRVIII